MHGATVPAAEPAEEVRAPQASGQTVVANWTAAGMAAGIGLGVAYGLACGAVVRSGLVAAYGLIIGLVVGSVAGPVIGAVNGLALLLLRRTGIPHPVITAAATELMLLPVQLLLVRLGTGLYMLLVGAPSLISVAAAAALARWLPLTGGQPPPRSRRR